MTETRWVNIVRKDKKRRAARAKLRFAETVRDALDDDSVLTDEMLSLGHPTGAQFCWVHMKR